MAKVKIFDLHCINDKDSQLDNSISNLTDSDLRYVNGGYAGGA